MSSKSSKNKSSALVKFFLLAAVVVVSASFLTYQKSSVLGSSTQEAQTKNGITINLNEPLKTAGSSIRTYRIGLTDGYDFCHNGSFSYNVNGMSFSITGALVQSSMICYHSYGLVSSSNNCNTFSAPVWNLYGIGYRKLNSGWDTYHYVSGAKSVKLCNYDYDVIFYSNGTSVK